MINWLRRLFDSRTKQPEASNLPSNLPTTSSTEIARPARLQEPSRPSSLPDTARRTSRATSVPRTTPPVSRPSIQSTAPATTTNRVNWGSSELLPSNLVDALDPILQTPLRPGERVHVCQRCQTGYHSDSFAFLRNENRGACVGCRKTDQFIVMVLPTVRGTSPYTSETPPISTHGTIDLSKIRNFIGQVVDFEGEVVKVHQSRQGTYFVKFEDTQRPFDGFNLVVFNRYEDAWLSRGMTPQAYQGRRIRVHGLVNEHPTWGLQIIVNTPDVVSTVTGTGSKAKMAWKTQ